MASYYFSFGSELLVIKQKVLNCFYCNTLTILALYSFLLYQLIFYTNFVIYCLLHIAPNEVN